MKLLTVFVAVVLHVFTSEVLSACELASRIKHNDSEVIVTQTDQPCTLTLTARNNKQVVVVMYDFEIDCTKGRANVAIYDGSSSNMTKITESCQANTWSFASRRHSLTLKPTSGAQLRPFNLDIHAVGTFNQYFNTTGTIMSDRFPGYISASEKVNTTPNNFLAVYEIKTKGSASIRLEFNEFRVESDTGGQCSGDYVLIKTSSDKKICGDGNLAQKTYIAYGHLRLEFVTDAVNTYTGFTAVYKVCQRETDENYGAINFSAFDNKNDTVCAHIINLNGKEKVTFSLAFPELGGCKDMLKVYTDGKMHAFSSCASNTEFMGSVEASKQVELRLTLKRGQSVTGNYSKGSPSDNSMYSSFSNTKNSVIIPVVVSLAVVLVIIVIVVGVCLRKRLQKAGKAPGAKYQPDIGEVDVYADNEDYDQLRTQRDHKMTSNDKNSNIYGVTHAPRDEYAVVNKTKKGMNLQPTEEYDQQEFGNEYDATTTTKSSKNVSNDNFYE